MGSTWVFDLYQEYLGKGRKKAEAASREDLARRFEAIRGACFVKILVQEPWMGTIRFKTLAYHAMEAPEVTGLLQDPMAYLKERYGGGKFKVNFYHGMNFVATKNFKPPGAPLWEELPEWS